MLEKSASDTSVASVRRSNQKKHCYVFVHRKLARRPEDRYVVDLAMALKNQNHKVSVMTSELDANSCLEEVNVS